MGKIKYIFKGILYLILFVCALEWGEVSVQLFFENINLRYFALLAVNCYAICAAIYGIVKSIIYYQLIKTFEQMDAEGIDEKESEE